MGFARDDVVVVHTCWKEFSHEDGYLQLRKNMRIKIEYVGATPDDMGWLFGFDRNDSQGFHGWFPEDCVSKLTSMPAPKPKPKPPPKPKDLGDGSVLHSATLSANPPSAQPLAHTVCPPPPAATLANPPSEQQLAHTVCPPPPAATIANPPSEQTLAHTVCPPPPAATLANPPAAQPLAHTVCPPPSAATLLVPSTLVAPPATRSTTTKNSQQPQTINDKVLPQPAPVVPSTVTATPLPCHPGIVRSPNIEHASAEDPPALSKSGSPPPPVAINLASVPLVPPPPGRPPTLPPPSGPPPAELLRNVIVPPPSRESVSEAFPCDVDTDGDDENVGDGELALPGFDSPVSRVELGEEVATAAAAAAELPMAQLREKLLRLVLRRRVVVIDAATGSGKSTMVPLYLLGQCVDLGRSCRIVVTQPRRLAAKGLATRVSQQAGLGGKVGHLAGYRVGNDKQDYGAPIVYVTAGHLLEALVHNPHHLDTFSHIVLDEVHERFVEADFLMALLRLALSRPETMAVRVVVMSATLQKTLGDFFRPILLPSPENAVPATLSLPSGTPYDVEEYIWEDSKNNWPSVFPGDKEPDFNEYKFSRMRNLQPKRRSDMLTRLCKELAPFCVRLLCALRKSGHEVALVFLPGLDQMREVEDKLQQELVKLNPVQYGTCEIFLMHSALEEETYRDALSPKENERNWRVVLATNIAESSLTVPGVDAVIDFGMHRVNIYDDEARMSMLATEWCSRASAKQRRGRTGRTNDGVYIQLIGRPVLSELRDFDESGVERSPLTRVTLEAAHLAELFNARPAVRAGLPVSIEIPPESRDSISDEGMQASRRVAGYWHGPGQGWRMGSERKAGEDCTTAFSESVLTPLPIDAYHMLSLLPAPPKEDRIQHALTELHELGALTSDDTPSVLGTAYLKIPVDVPLGRLVVLAWIMGCPADGAALAAALSLAPACDVFRTPFNTKQELSKQDLDVLMKTIKWRRKFDAGHCSEPMTVLATYHAFIEAGGGFTGRRGGSLGRKPQTEWGWYLNERMWVQFIEKTIDILAALQRLSPPDMPEMKLVEKLLKCLRGSGRLAPEELRELRSDPRHVQAVLTWALAPGGFVAVGQTPALYNEGGAYTKFKQMVKKHAQTPACTGTPLDRTSALYWPQIKESNALEILRPALGLKPAFVVPDGEGTSELQMYLGFAPDRCAEGQMPLECEFLVRICGPFNGRPTTLNTNGHRAGCPRPPKHPCTFNWFMPRRDGDGILEVRVNWKSQADTLLHMPSRAADARCRPKRFMVASGAEYHSSAGRRAIFLRGSTVLPSEDGGRSAFLWLLAAGLPRECNFVAMAAPCENRTPGEFEVRALRMWRRTFWLPRNDPLTSYDLREVNSFRSALLQMQRRKPHRLAGMWKRRDSNQERQIECIDEELGGKRECLLVTDGTKTWTLRGEVAGHEWTVELPNNRKQSCDDLGMKCHEVEGHLEWSCGDIWIRHETSETPVLSGLGVSTVRKLRQAGQKIWDITSVERGDPVASTKWIPRLVPFSTINRNADARSHFLAPLDLNPVETSIDNFAKKLRQTDIESEDEDQDGDVSEEELEDEARNCAGSDEESEDGFDGVDTTQEGIDDEFLLRLARQTDFSVAESRNLLFVETSLALPKTAICVECEEEGKPFSKSQLSKHVDERRCKQCVAKSSSSAYKPTSCFGGPKTTPITTLQQSNHLPDGVLPALSGQTGVAVCSVCRLKLTKDNCSASQRQKGPTRRKCTRCMQSS